jgi:hypothetical protein
VADRDELVRATDRPIRWRGYRADGWRARRRGWRVDRRIVAEDRFVEIVEVRSWLDPELLDEDVAGVAVGLKRVGLAAAAIQREHQLRV